MDRLISEQQVINAIKTWATPLQVSNSEMIEDLWVNGACELIKAIPSAEPYKGMTNGQVHDMLYQMLVELKDGADRYGAEKWWNSPYKGGEQHEGTFHYCKKSPGYT